MCAPFWRGSPEGRGRSRAASRCRPRSRRTKKVGRREFWRAKLTQGADGRPLLVKFPRDGSGLISSLREADGLIEIPEDVAEVNPGDPVDFIPFTEFGLPS